MKKLVLVTNDLPGSGKSTLAEVLVAKFSSEGLAIGHLATNCSEDAEERFSPSPEITPWDFDEDREMSTLLASLDESDAVVVDMGTGDLADFYEIAETVQLFDILGELGVELTLAIPLFGDGDPTETVVEIAETFSDNADYVVVSDGKLPQDTWDGSYAQKVMKYLGAVEIIAPVANGALSKALGEHGYDLHEAQAHRNDLPRGLKTPLNKWEQRFGGELGTGARDFIYSRKAEEPSAHTKNRASKGAVRIP